MIKNILHTLLFMMMMASSCQSGPQKNDPNDLGSYQPGTFGYDLHFLRGHDEVVVLQSDQGRAQVLVSPKYQGKVFTSTADSLSGASFGWVNYKAFSGPLDEHMNGYGGENRFWLGPEGGKFSLFFKPGSEMVFDHWKTPAPFDSEAWSVTSQNDTAVALQKEMALVNYQGTSLKLMAQRTIRILSRQQVAEKLGLSLGDSLRVVGYESRNQITNRGDQEWTERTGMPCIWILDMFKPTPSTVIVVPFRGARGLPFSKVATTNYFGQIPADRLKHNDEVLFFKADGKSRGKLGIVPDKARPVAGSYDPQNHLLTITLFDLAPEAKYLNQEWKTTPPPFSGDAVNAYNDGPLADGAQMGPFYEIESVSPAAFLKPGQSLAHHHSVFHFTGPQSLLEPVAQKLLGVSLDQIVKAF
jgi:hypothetical protein